MIPVSIETIMALWVITVFGALTPGPDVVYIVSNAIGGQFKQGFSAVLGIFSGLVIYVLAVVSGLSVIFDLLPQLFEIVRILGVGYLLYIAYGFLRSALQSKAVDIKKATDTKLSLIFKKGIFLNLLNPKTTLFFTAILPQFIIVENGQITVQMMILGFSCITAGFIVYSCYALFTALVSRKVQSFSQQKIRLASVSASLTYMFFAAKLAVAKLN